MPSRQLPRTNDERTTAKNAGFTKYGLVAPADRLITPDQFTTLGTERTAWNNAMGALPALLEAQGTLTGQAETQEALVRRYVSHFIQVFNFAIARGEMPAAQRAFYGLDISNDLVPPLLTQADLQLWGDRMVAGEVARLAAVPGAPPMAWPSADQITLALYNWRLLLNAQSAALDAYDDGQQAVSDLVAADDALILDLWDTIEYNLRTETAPSLRRRAREWGVVYADDPAPPIVPPPTPPVP